MTRVVLMGLEGQLSLEKDVFERYLRGTNLANSKHLKIPQPKRPQWDYYIQSAFHVVDGINISRRGLSRVAYPDARQCESPYLG